MESEKRINWLSLFIKIVIIFIFVLIMIWLISKIVGNNKLSETFISNINNMEKVSVEYFKTIDLPLKKGKSTKITLGELIEKELIVSDKNTSANACDTKKSYSEIRREKDKYVVKTTLNCGKEKDTIKTNFSLKDCKNCNTTNKEETSNNNGTTHYEYIKKTTTYTNWIKGNLTGNNIENKYEYYNIADQVYYTLGAISSNKKSATYILKLDKVPNKKYYFTTVEEISNFIEKDEDNYLKEKNVSVYKGNKISTPENISEYSLEESNFTYKVTPYYKKGSFYIKVTITINNVDGIKPYYDNKIKENVYLIPLKMNIQFASDIISETKPEGKYETISYYRYVTTKEDIVWSTESSLDGYTKTGNTKIK